MKSKIKEQILKIIFIIFIFSFVILLETEVNAAIYGQENFGEEYSNGYIRTRGTANIIRMSSGISAKLGKQINSGASDRANYQYYTCNNTSKSQYIDYSEAARYINNSGESIWLDMRIYIWTNNSKYPWAIIRNVICVENIFNSGIQHTNLEYHFYTAGHCGEPEYEQSFRGVLELSDLDSYEGFALHSGYNKVYLSSGAPIISVYKGNKNSTSGYNPFGTSGNATYTYFFGTRMNSGTDNIWVEIDSTPSSPFTITYGTRYSIRGSHVYYTGTAIEYYVDGVLKDTSYCVPYGKYKLIDTTKLNAQKYGYNIDGWYTNTSYTTKVQSGIAGNSTIRVYGRYIRYTITVDNDRNGHTYNSYQVFQGDYYEKEGNNGEKIPTLLNIDWSSELQKEIATEIESEKGKTHGDKILETLKDKNPDLYKDCQTAHDIAEILRGKPNDGDVIREFTDIVGKYILDNDIPITKGTSTLTEGNYKIKDLDPGYYIVIDAAVNEKDDAYSRYLIDVVQDVTMYPKTSIPRINKKVGKNNVKTLVNGTYVEDEKRNTATYKKESENYNAEDYDIEFELKSYIPDVTGYNTYKFEVVDILAKGFDYDRNSVKVILGENEYPKTREKIVEGNEELGEEDRIEIVNNYTIKDIVIDVSNYETYKKYFEEEGKEYPEGYAESNYGKTLILIEINDLVGQVKDGTVEKGQDIFVRYNAKLNGKGEVGTTPNINEAYIKYSNDPYHNDKESQTTTQTTYTYTIDLNLIKIAELKEESSIRNYLEGAEFEIYNKPETVQDRTPIATIKTDEILDSEGNIINSAGKALYSSLGAGTYYIKETKSPEGYNKLREEIVIEVKATCDEYGSITWSVDDKINNNLVLIQMGVKDETSIPEIKLQVENTSGLHLPVTGGKGTVLFTVIGISVMLVVIFQVKLIRKNK